MYSVNNLINVLHGISYDLVSFDFLFALFAGYAIVATVLGGMLLIAVATSIIIYLLRKRNLNSYRKLETEEDKCDTKEKTIQLDQVNDLGTSAFKQYVRETAIDTETYAESFASDVFGNETYQRDRRRRLSSLSSSNVQGRSPIKLYLSLVLNSDRKYLAGKVTKIEGMSSVEGVGHNQVKIHVSLLPVRRYILKTRYHDITSTASFDEYFKTKFKALPDIKSVVRFRLYCRRLKYGMPSRDRCLGECYVKLKDIAKASGGHTLSREILPRATGQLVSQSSCP